MSLSFLRGRVLTGLLVLLPASVSFSQSASADRAISANDLVRAVVTNELNSHDAYRTHWMYHMDREEQGKKKAKEVVETAQGTLDRLVAVDGHPLPAKQQEEEMKRIENLVKNPAEQRRLELSKRKDAEQGNNFFKMIPDAFVFTYSGREGDLIKLSYRPNPDFRPLAREARVFHEMEGEMWVHEKQRRLAHIRGQLMADVKFAGGLLGYLHKGGRFNVEQRELLPGQWELTLMEIDMQGKALFFKTIAVQEKEHRSNFRTVPGNLTLSEARDILTKQAILAAKQ